MDKERFVLYLGALPISIQWFKPVQNLKVFHSRRQQFTDIFIFWQ